MIVPVPKPASDVEAEVFEFVKASDPSAAYLQGANEYVGKLFIPSRKNLEKVAKRADELRLKAENNAQLKVIDSFAACYALQEPQLYPDGVLSAFFGYLIKEGVVPSHLRALTRNAVRAMRAAAEETSQKRWPSGLRLLTLIRCRSEEHTSELQSLRHLVCRLLLEKKKQRAKRLQRSYEVKHHKAPQRRHLHNTI